MCLSNTLNNTLRERRGGEEEEKGERKEMKDWLEMFISYHQQEHLMSPYYNPVTSLRRANTGSNQLVLSECVCQRCKHYHQCKDHQMYCYSSTSQQPERKSINIGPWLTRSLKLAFTIFSSSFCFLSLPCFSLSVSPYKHRYWQILSCS